MTGTDTGVGKTLVSTILCMRFGFHYWKPVQCGTEPMTDSDFLRQFVSAEKIYTEGNCFMTPCCPDLASEIEGVKLDISLYGELCKDMSADVLIEGAGGLLVPLNDSQLMIDLIKMLECEVILVARSSLGTINHTLLSIDALKKWKISLHSIVFVGPMNIKTTETIKRFSRIERTFHLPHLPKLDSESLTKAFTFFQGMNL